MRSTCGRISTGDRIPNFWYCGNRAEQRCYFRRRNDTIYAKPLRWKKNYYFYSSYEFGYNELFCSEAARKLMGDANFPLRYIPVLHEKSGQEIPDMYYLEPVHLLPQEAIDFSNMHVQSSCVKCGQTTWNLQDQDQLCMYRQYLNDSCDIYATPRIWGPMGASPAIIVSHTAYAFLRENHMDRGIRFVPIGVRD